MDELIRRGEMHWVSSNSYSMGSEMKKDRPAIVVSNNEANEHSDTIEIVYMTTNPHKNLPTHVHIQRTSSGDGEGSTALCESVYTISKNRLYEDSYYGRVSDEDMEAIDRALLASLDLERYIGGVEEKTEKQDDKRASFKKNELLDDIAGVVRKTMEEMHQNTDCEEPEEDDGDVYEELAKSKMEAAFYKEQYDQLMERIMQKAKI